MIIALIDFPQPQKITTYEWKHGTVPDRVVSRKQNIAARCDVPDLRLLPKLPEKFYTPACIEFGRRLRGMTRTELAAQTGIPRRFIVRYERGQVPVPEDDMQRLLTVLEVPLRFFQRDYKPLDRSRLRWNIKREFLEDIFGR